MATRGLIVIKDEDVYKYGQTHFDSYNNTEWLQKHLNTPSEVSEFAKQMTVGEGFGIDSLSYTKIKAADGTIDFKPVIEWKDCSYCCGIIEKWEFTYNDLRGDYFDFPEYISYWDGSSWTDYKIGDYKSFLERLK